MRPTGLYVKIFVSFVAILLLTVILTFGLFRMLGHSRPKPPGPEGIILVHWILLNELDRRMDDKSFYDLLRKIAFLDKSQLWTSRFKTFPGDYPSVPAHIKERKGYAVGAGREGFYIRYELPVRGKLHFYHTRVDEGEEGYFILGLLIITGFIALLILPLARYITVPLRRLHDATVQMTAGDLSRRTDLPSSRFPDEIADLAKAFDTMAGSVQAMVETQRETTASLSHELRSPLTRLQLHMELMRNELPATAKKRLVEMEREVDDMDGIIGHILDMSRLQVVQEDARETDLRSTLLDVVGRNESRSERNQITVHHDLHSVHILVPPVTLRLALNNILENAFRHTPMGGTINIRLRKSKESVGLEVENTSEGRTDLSQIYEPFHFSEHGTGLGLAVAKRACDRMNASIHASEVKNLFRVSVNWKL